MIWIIIYDMWIFSSILEFMPLTFTICLLTNFRFLLVSSNAKLFVWWILSLTFFLLFLIISFSRFTFEFIFFLFLLMSLPTISLKTMKYFIFMNSAAILLHRSGIFIVFHFIDFNVKITLINFIFNLAFYHNCFLFAEIVIVIFFTLIVLLIVDEGRKGSLPE